MVPAPSPDPHPFPSLPVSGAPGKPGRAWLGFFLFPVGEVGISQDKHSGTRTCIAGLRVSFPSGKGKPHFLHVYVYMFIFVCMQVQVYVCMCACVSQRTTLGVIFQELSILFWTVSFIGSELAQGWLVEPRDTPISASSVLGLQV